MDNSAKGCEIVVSGKLRGQRAKSMKFRDGYMIKSGQPTKDYVDVAIRHVLLRQGVLGIKVAIMLPWDPSGKTGPRTPQPDVVKVLEPKEEEVIPTPTKGFAPQAPSPIPPSDIPYSTPQPVEA